MNFDKEAKSDKKNLGGGAGGGGGGGGTETKTICQTVSNEVGGGALKPKQYARLCQMR